MKPKFKTLVVCIAVPLAVGGLAALITGGGAGTFKEIAQPSLTPPAWLFPVVWTILYVLMGIASCLVLNAGASQELTESALSAYGLQLAVNFIWPILFFNFNLYYFSFFWLILLWVLILITMVRFSRVSKPALYLMLPYILWVTFAGYLNLAIAIVN